MANKSQLLGNYRYNTDVKKSRFIANNTLKIDLIDGTEIIRYHYTDIITKMPDGNVILNTGGWHTVSTISRINTFYENRSFYIYTRAYELLFDYKGEKALFYDGIIFDQHGNILSELKRPIILQRKIDFRARFEKKLKIKIDEMPEKEALRYWYWNQKAYDRRKFKGKLKTLIKHLQEEKFDITENDQERLLQIHKTLFEY